MNEAERRFLDACDDPATQLELYTNRYRRVEHPWGLSDRQFDYHVLYYILQHEVAVRMEGRHAVMGPQTFMWLAPNVRHTLGPPDKGRGRKKVRLIHIVFKIWRGDQTVTAPYPLIVAPQASELQAQMRMFHEQLQIKSSHGQHLQRYLLGSIACLAFHAQAAGQAAQERGLDYAQRERLRELVARTPAHELHPRDLAREVGLSHDYFTRLFTHSFGVSPRHWLHQERLDQAAALLVNTSDSVTSIAQACGYPDVFPFSKQFKKRFGQSPSHFRRNSEGWNEGAFT